MVGLEIGLLCLALNVYYEARSESDEAQMAVALVTRNRARYKDRTLCEEVYSPHQFSWTRQITCPYCKLKPPHPQDEAWIKAQLIARDSLTAKDFTKGAYWYHRYDIHPWWTWNKQKVGTWGAHVFYKCKPKFRCNWR